LGGRAAEEIVFGEITTGASSDLSRVTEIARSMVTRWGMSEKLGPMTFGKKEELIFLGKEIAEQRDFSEAVAEQIDEEVRGLVQAGHETALRILTEHRDKLEAVARKLIEVETLGMEEFEAVYVGETPSEPPASGGTPVSAPKSPSPGRPSPASGPAPVPVPSGA
jgi:cell division protease FtsH